MAVADVAISNAAYGGDARNLKRYLKGGGNPSCVCVNGWPLLCLAAINGRCRVLRLLLDHGAAVGGADDRYGETALHVAAACGHRDAAALLLDRGARVDARARNGSTPLHKAAFDGGTDVLRLLLSRGADLGARDSYGDAETNARDFKIAAPAKLLADVRVAGGWTAYARAPRLRVLALRVLAEQGRARTSDPLLARLFPAGAPRGISTDARYGPTRAFRNECSGALPPGVGGVTGSFQTGRSRRNRGTRVRRDERNETFRSVPRGTPVEGGEPDSAQATPRTTDGSHLKHALYSSYVDWAVAAGEASRATSPDVDALAALLLGADAKRSRRDYRASEGGSIPARKPNQFEIRFNSNRMRGDRLFPGVGGVTGSL